MGRNIKVIGVFVLSLMSVLLNAQNSDLEVIVKKGRQAYDAGNYENSIKWFKQAYKFDKKSNEIMCELALSYLAYGDYTNAALYSGKVISNNKTDEFREESYIIHGNSWDKQLRRKRAQKVYREGMDEYPSNYLMRYHLANSLFREKKLDEAEAEVIALLEINAGYSDAHVLMAYIQYEKGERIRAMLPLYYALLIDQDADKSESVYDFLNALWVQGVRVKAQRESKLFTSGVNLGDFVEQEYLLGQYELEKDSIVTKKDGMKNVTLLQFCEDTQYLFQSLSNQKEVQYGYFWEFYVDIFSKVHKNDFSESFCYFISDCKYNDDVLVWLASNYQHFSSFTDWMELQ